MTPATTSRDSRSNEIDDDIFSSRNMFAEVDDDPVDVDSRSRPTSANTVVASWTRTTDRPRRGRPTIHADEEDLAVKPPTKSNHLVPTYR